MTDKKPKKILVVDDEMDVTELLAYHLKAKGFLVETVNNPNRSVGLARTFLPDLVILDVMMPELNGIQICRMLRADPKLKRVPVIFLTAKAEETIAFKVWRRERTTTSASHSAQKNSCFACRPFCGA